MKNSLRVTAPPRESSGRPQGPSQPSPLRGRLFRRKCHACHGRGIFPGITPDSSFSCPHCLGTGEECGHAELTAPTMQPCNHATIQPAEVSA
jgi:hypothetical protein